MRDHYDESLSLRDAVAAYFAANRFGADGGYGDKWVKLKLGPLGLYMPNTAARVAAVRFHDLHHIVTGFRTDWRGEFEISAWELAAGCGRFYAAWWLNLGGLNAGLLVCPRRTLAAFRLGLRSRSLYGESYNAELLARSVKDARTAMGLALNSDGQVVASEHTRSHPVKDAWVFAAYAAASIPVAVVTLLATIFVFVPTALLQSGKPRDGAMGKGTETPGASTSATY